MPDPTRQLVRASVVDIRDRKAAEAATAKRAAELATVAEVGTTVSSIMDPVEMLQTVVDLAKERFELYHAHIYLLDEKGETLKLAAGAGEVGEKMVSEGWQIPLEAEQSIVAQAVRERKGISENDVQENPDFLPNPLLPDTHAEMAVPLIAGDRIIGVLDVQSEEVGAFSEEDVSIQTTLASQIAVALQNARTYAATQRQAEHESLINLISQQIQSTTSVENALQVAVRELGRALGAKRTSVKLDVSQN
jgi:GAF domain-containing protein